MQEFRHLEYLSDSPTDYQLVKVADAIPLDEDLPLNQQSLMPEEQLTIREKFVEGEDLPEGSLLPPDPIYLREQTGGKVYKLQWLPAIIGRPDANQPLNELVAVNLEAYQTGLRVSRRHAKITEENGTYFIESMSRNPTIVRGHEGDEVRVTDGKWPLQNGDFIYLERSKMMLKFIIRQTEEEAHD